MATKSIIDIDVNDQAFTRFLDAFRAYSGELAGTSAAWARANAAANATAGSVKDTATATTEAAAGARDVAVSTTAAAAAAQQMSVAFHGQVQFITNAGKSQLAGTHAAKEQAGHWNSMARSAKGFASHIGDATRSLLRWASLTGLISGILGGGGLFGIDRLATSAGDQKRSTMGLGVTPGEKAAFETNYGRVVDPGAVLGGVNEALIDPNKRSALYGAGLTERDLKGKDAAQVSVEALSSIKKLVDHTNTNMLGALLTARHLDQLGLSEQDLQRLKNTPSSELDKYRTDYDRDKQTMDLDKPTTNAWQDLQVQLKRAGTEIENTFIKGLTPLAKPLEDLSKGFTDLVASLLQSPEIKKWIESLAGGLEHLSQEIGTEEFKKSVTGIVDSLAHLTASLADDLPGIQAAFHAIALLGKGVEGAANGVDALVKPWKVPTPINPDNPHPGDPPRPSNLAPVDNRPGYQQLWDWWQSKGPSLTPSGSSGAPTPAAYRPDMAGGSFGPYGDLENQWGLQPGLLRAVEKTESNNRDVVSSAGAKGFFQFMDPTARQYGVDVHDEQSSAKGMAHYFADLLKEFGGDLPKAIAAENWGQGNLEKDIKQYGNDWRNHLPAETANHINRIMGQLANGQVQPGRQPARRGGDRTEVTIRNNTGGSAVVSASQLNT
jgi:Transglycosylase SLT domain